MHIVNGNKMALSLLVCAGLFSAASQAINIDITGKVVASPCIVNGNDMGEQLYSMGVMGWFMLVTIPTGLIALAVYGVILLIIWLVVGNRNSKARN